MSPSPIVLITGASGGIGRALAQQLRLRDWRIAAVGRDADTLAALQADARIVADLTEPGEAQEAINACTELIGAPSHLAHMMGSTLAAPFHKTVFLQWEEALRVNLISAIAMLQAWIRSRREVNLPGAAVLASSVVAQIGVANHEVIAAAKGGIDALVRSAASSYAAQGLRINAVSPGMTDTPMTASMLRLEAQRESAGRQYPLGGIQMPKDIAAVAAWLLSDEASRITGQIIPVDGGFTAIRPLVR